MTDPIEDEAHHVIRHWQDQAIKLKQAYDDVKLYSQSISDDKESLRDENEGLRTRLKDMETELEFIKQENYNFKLGKISVNSEFENEVDFIQQEQLLQTEIKNLERLVECNKKRYHSAEIENEYLTSQNKELTSRNESLDANKIELHQEIKLLKQEQERLLFSNSELEQENISLQRQLSYLNKLKINVNELQDELIQVKLDHKTATQKLKATMDDNKRLSSQLEESLNVLTEERNQNKALQTQLVQQTNVTTSNISWSAEQLLQTNRNVNGSDEESFATTMSFSSSTDRDVNSGRSSYSGTDYVKVDSNEEGRSEREAFENDLIPNPNEDFVFTTKNTQSKGIHDPEDCHANISSSISQDLNPETGNSLTLSKLSVNVSDFYRFSSRNVEIMDNFQCKLLCIVDEIGILCKQVCELLNYDDAASQIFMKQLQSIPATCSLEEEFIYDPINNGFENPRLKVHSDNIDVSSEVIAILISESEKCQEKVTSCCKLVRSIGLEVDLLLDHIGKRQMGNEKNIRNTNETVMEQVSEYEKLKSLLAAKNEQVSTLKLVLKTSKATSESEISHIRSKYEKAIQQIKNENAVLKTSLDALQSKDTTYHNVRADFASKCEEYITKIDSMQKDINEAEKERKILNQLLTRTINQKIALTQQLEDVKLEIEDMRIKSLKASGLHHHSLVRRV